jgi:hypothetical protein
MPHKEAVPSTPPTPHRKCPQPLHARIPCWKETPTSGLDNYNILSEISDRDYKSKI